MLLDVAEGKGPILMRTEEAIANLAAEYKDDPKVFKKKMKELDSEAWEDFLDMTISQAILWAATNVSPDEKPSEIAAAEPYFIGSHSGANGAWVSGPEDLAPPEYFWGYTNMCTTKGLFAAGDASGASSHKFSSGSLTEGRIVGKSICKFAVENTDACNYDDAAIDTLLAEQVAPLALYADSQSLSSQEDINPAYIVPKMFMMRLQKMMDEYAGGVTAQFTTSKPNLDRCLELLAMLKEDGEKLGAKDLHQLMRAWENKHRMYQAEVHVRTMLFREESRWPGYYFRTDCPKMDEENWKVFVNATMNPETEEWTMKKVDIKGI
jgi:adenylylsulfate reductase subunit A